MFQLSNQMVGNISILTNNIDELNWIQDKISSLVHALINYYLNIKIWECCVE